MRLHTMRTIFFVFMSVLASSAWPMEATIQNTLDMKFALIPAGEFTMGSDESAESLAKSYPQSVVSG